MRYESGCDTRRGGFTAQQRRERVRLEAAERFERGDGNRAIAADLPVTVRSVERWRQAWRQGGSSGLESKGPQSLPRLSERQFGQLEGELEKGPLAHGWEDQRWTLARIKTLIGRRFHVSYTVQGVWKPMRRNGRSCQQPVRRAIERDDGAVEMWKKQVWPQVRAQWRRSEPGWCSRTRPGSR
ncbi:winged helix-turn-helix domain-containing protein [Kitasatospora sp. NPDC101235]|uniref:winged helix-turn-helix domain-containing protein n=1 Tax=Kitasatospora sp. NPDC101235 TaxID=3364101 RepID=UPI00381358D2